MDLRSAVAPHEVPSRLEGSAVTTTPYPASVDGADHYFSPLRVYKYTAVDLPVVTSMSGQIPVTLLGCGILVPPSDATALVRTTDTLVRDSGRRAELGAQTRLAAEERHSWEGVMRRVLELVEA